MYQPDSSIAVEVRLEAENVWLNRQQIAILFERVIKTTGKHINNALNEELAEFSTVAKFATTAADLSALVPARQSKGLPEHGPLIRNMQSRLTEFYTAFTTLLFRLAGNCQ